MLPIRDERPNKGCPIVTFILLVANITVFFWQIFSPEGNWSLILRFGLIPSELTAAFDMGLLQGIIALSCFVTAIFLHGGLIHLGGNMLFLWVFACGIEDALGHFRFLLFYLCCGILASLTHFVLHLGDATPMIGASGAVSGVLGAYFLLYPFAPIRTIIWYFIFIRIVRIPALIFIGLWFLFQVLASLSGNSGVAWFAHIGGFFAGMGCLFFFLPKRRPSRRVKFRMIK